MNRHGFLLGLYATGGQVLLLRELLAAFHGSELFVGVALFGWLWWVASGAYFGGRTRSGPGVMTLLALGSVILPLAVLATRLLPLVVVDVIGEHIPFATSALLSVAAMLPVGALAGWLFPTIVRSDVDPDDAIISVYFFEGLGAFVGGLSITLAVGEITSTFAASVWLGVAVCAALVLPHRAKRVPLPLLVGMGLLVMMLAGGGRALEHHVDRLKHPGYTVVASFDTHYGRQAILQREGHTVLMTDNFVEAQAPDSEGAEFKLLPPLLYEPGARTVLYVGRAEFGVGALLDNLPEVTLIAVDPRSALTERLGTLGIGAGRAVRVDGDPVRYLEEKSLPAGLDVMVLDVAALDTYAAGRLLTPDILMKIKRTLGEGGVLYVITPYDTERYTAPEARRTLSLVREGLREVFPAVAVWPGTSTRFFAGEAGVASQPTDNLLAAVEALPYQPLYLDRARLSDMLNDFRRDQLNQELAPGEILHTLDRPLLTTMHATYLAGRNRADRIVLEMVLKRTAWLVLLPVGLLVALVVLLRRKDPHRRLGLWLYFTAGSVSLAYVLLAFYVFQCTVGSLYSHVAVLVGTFMMGLSLGAWYTARAQRDGFEYPALVTLAVAGLIFLFTHGLVDPRLALLYHMLFLLTTALATGSLFAAATRRYYRDAVLADRGRGYAVELIGSGLSALLVTTVLLPTLGLNWLLVACVALLGVTVGACAASRR